MNQLTISAAGGAIFAAEMLIALYLYRRLVALAPDSAPMQGLAYIVH